jgi:hypothetical protein
MLTHALPVTVLVGLLTGSAWAQPITGGSIVAGHGRSDFAADYVLLGDGFSLAGGDLNARRDRPGSHADQHE